MNTETKPTHTPGPWMVARSDSRVILGHSQSFHETIAQVPGKFSAESNANACLIASAPDLLEALKDALFVIQGESQKGNYLDSSERDMSLEGVLEQAIAKAEGK